MLILLLHFPGTFSQRFTSPGMYHYTSEEVIHQNPYRLRGVIIVDPPEQNDAKLSVKVNDVQATIVGKKIHNSMSIYLYIEVCYF